MCVNCQNSNCSGCNNNGISVETPCTNCTPTPCPTQECSEITPLTCIQNTTADKTCGNDTVYLQGDNLGTVLSKITDYFCARLSTIDTEIENNTIIVDAYSCGDDEVYQTGDTVVEALEKTVDYYCTRLSTIDQTLGNLAQVAFSGSYSDLSDVPTSLSDFTNDPGYITSAPNFATDNLDFTGPRVHDALGNDLTISNLAIQTENFVFSNYSGYKDLTNSNGNVLMRHFSNGELHYDAHLGSAGETIKHTSGRWDLPNTVTINKPNFDANTLVNIKAQSASSLDTVFGLRNSTDTSWLFRQANNGNSYFYGEVYGETFRNLYFVTPRITIGSAIDYISRGEFGFAHTAHTFDTDTTITTPGSYLMQWKNGGSERFRKYLNGEFTHYHSTSGYSYEWWDYGNGFPAFTMEAPNGGQLQQRFRYNGVNKANFSLNSAGNKFNMNTQDNVLFEMRHVIDFVSNNVHVQKTVDGEWLFTNDPTSLQTPETGVRAKFYGQVKTVSPSASALDTAFSVRNNTDTANLLNIQGNGLFNLGASTYTDTQHVIRNTSSYFYIHRVLDSSENILFNVSRTEINLNIATGFNGGAETATVAKFWGRTKIVSPSASALDTAFAVRNNTDTANLFYIKGNGDIEHLTGFMSIGTSINTNAKFNVYTATVDAAIRGYSDTAAGKAIIAQADGNGAIGIQANALNVGGGTAARLSGTTYSILFNGPIMDDAQNTLPTFPQANGAGEAALLATLAVGRWYYLDNGDGTGTVKVKL